MNNLVDSFKLFFPELRHMNYIVMFSAFDDDTYTKSYMDNSQTLIYEYIDREEYATHLFSHILK